MRGDCQRPTPITTTLSAQVDADQRDGDADRLGEAAQEHPAEQGQQDQRDRDLVAVRGSAGRWGSRSGAPTRRRPRGSS